MKRRFIAAAAFLLLLALPVTAGAQANIYLGGGATLPQGDYGDFAKTGWMAQAGITYFLASAPGLGIWGGGSYGSNSHEGTSGDKTNLFGAHAGLIYRIGNTANPGVYVLGGAGMLNHQYKPGEAGEPSENDWEFAWLGGAGVDIPLSSVGLWFEGTYNARGDTKWFGINAGVSISLGGGGM